ncbi:hypothetical protein A4N80_07670 [Salmonella enterica subsp. enterica serovar Mississippi]|uniref:Uncharacterized protein n=5 Tax=Salmonella enterica TaxID=28901 RepID=A0A3W7TPV6_SALER|nr:hypothetical protein LFZ8_00970 [Salmonella enterica subsp. enterica serovar Djakarta str. S-1087]APY57929.1 hypothetical protein LFZ14_01055 [Salmonella enterica subsp. enterica serovar Hillingdon str. N1529-D3]EAA0892485.1 hypothetical protein [Salmonella enterica subsp. enterica serovar Orientalis]EAA1044021.1 hypothetical protein [Salmonella enterica subsp. enterica serovar Westeinde]EAA1508778.1 hypothetical protein [Salmonella enterica subsp. enterica serovar Agama]EAA2459915.1 hypoth
MLFLRNIQAQRPDSLFFSQTTEEEISQLLPLFRRMRHNALSGLQLHYEYFFVRRVGAVFAGSSGQTCLG